jgi:hypothetical protein
MALELSLWLESLESSSQESGQALKETAGHHWMWDGREGGMAAEGPMAPPDQD